jgi:hypothetical protein
MCGSNRSGLGSEKTERHRDLPDTPSTTISSKSVQETPILYRLGRIAMEDLTGIREQQRLESRRDVLTKVVPDADMLAKRIGPHEMTYNVFSAVSLHQLTTTLL